MGIAADSFSGSARNIPGVILAGGLARRMGGGDKVLRRLLDRPLLAHVLERLRPQAAPLALSANGDATRFAAWGVPVLADPVPDQPGPLAGVLAALTWAAAQGSPRVLTVPGDTPFLPRDLVARLLEAAMATEGPVAARSLGRTHPVIALWPTELAAPLAAALARGERRVGAWAQSRGAVAVDFPAEPCDAGVADPFLNVNTPDQLAAAAVLATPSPAPR